MNEPVGQVLIVDDTAANRHLLERLIQASGHASLVAENGEEALRLAAHHHPDLVLLDIKMPGMNGYTVCETLKADAQTADIPVVFMSALNQSEDKVRGLKAGAVDYITKPIDPDEAIARIKVHLRVGFLQRNLKEEVIRRQQAEEELRTINLDLEKRIAKRAAELIRTNEQLEGEIRERRSAESALRESRARYRTLFDNSPISLWVEDFSKVKRYLEKIQSEGVFDLVRHLAENDETIENCVERVEIVDVNRATLDLVGAESHEQMMSMLGQIEAEETISVWRGQLLALIEGRTPYETLFTFRTLDHRRVHTVLRVSIARGYEDSWSVVIVSMLDITPLKQTEFILREREGRLKAFANALPDPSGVVDETGLLVDMFSASDGTAAFSEENVGKHLQEFFPQRLANRLMGVVSHTIETGEQQTTDFRLPIGDEEHWYEVRVAPMFETDPMGPRRVVWIVRDITAREEARTARQDRELLQLELNKERELSDLKSRFVSMASHEFRTPLTTVRSSVDLMEHYLTRYLEENQLEKVQKHITKVQTSVDHITDLLDDVLIIGRNEAKGTAFTPKPLDLNAFIQEIIEEIRLSASEAHTLEFSIFGESYPVEMDAKLLRHIFTNLLSNAVKYSPDGGAVYFDLYWEPEQVAIRVADEGIGIPPKDQERLFQPFHRATNAYRLDGTGLGLAITRNSISAHGGTIEFESVLGEGTTFYLTIPTHIGGEQ